VPPPPPPPPPILPSLFTATALKEIMTNIPPAPPISSTIFDGSSRSKSNNSFHEKFKSTIKEDETTHLKNNNTSKEFDINEIKNFRFKKRSNSKVSVTDSGFTKKNNEKPNSWLSVMDEIKSGATKLRSVKDELKECGPHGYKTQSTTDISSYSKLEFDLNFILSQRNKFFNKDDDDDDENGSISSWNSSNNIHLEK
jgi:hypothetical protein